MNGLKTECAPNTVDNDTFEKRDPENAVDNDTFLIDNPRSTVHTDTFGQRHPGNAVHTVSMADLNLDCLLRQPTVVETQ